MSLSYLTMVSNAKCRWCTRFVFLLNFFFFRISATGDGLFCDVGSYQFNIPEIEWQFRGGSSWGSLQTNEFVQAGNNLGYTSSFLTKEEITAWMSVNGASLPSTVQSWVWVSPGNSKTYGLWNIWTNSFHPFGPYEHDGVWGGELDMTNGFFFRKNQPGAICKTCSAGLVTDSAGKNDERSCMCAMGSYTTSENDMLKYSASNFYVASGQYLDQDTVYYETTANGFALEFHHWDEKTFWANGYVLFSYDGVYNTKSHSLAEVRITNLVPGAAYEINLYHYLENGWQNSHVHEGEFMMSVNGGSLQRFDTIEMPATGDPPPTTSLRVTAKDDGTISLFFTRDMQKDAGGRFTADCAVFSPELRNCNAAGRHLILSGLSVAPRCTSCPVGTTNTVLNASSSDSCLCEIGHFQTPWLYPHATAAEETFTGSGNQVTLPQSLDLSGANDGFTIITKVKDTDGTTWNSVFELPDPSGGEASDGNMYLSISSANRLRIVVRNPGASTVCMVDSTAIFTTNSFHSVVVRYKTSENKLFLKVNNDEQSATCTDLVSFQMRTYTTLYVGKTVQWASSWTGMIAGFYIFDQYLDDTKNTNVLNSIVVGGKDVPVCLMCPLGSTTRALNASSSDFCVCPTESYLRQSGDAWSHFPPQNSLLGTFDPAPGENIVGFALQNPQTLQIKTNGGFTLVMKVKKSSFDHEHFFQVLRPEGNYHFYVGNYGHTDGFRFEIRDLSSIWCDTGSVGQIILAQEHHIVAQLLPATNRIKLIVDGVVYEQTCPANFGWQDWPSSGACFGGRWNAGTTSFSCDSNAYGSTLGAYYFNGILSSSAIQDVLGFIRAGEADWACQACPANQTTLVENARSLSDCVCAAGFFGPFIGSQDGLVSQFLFNQNLDDAVGSSEITVVSGTTTYISDATRGYAMDTEAGKHVISGGNLGVVLDQQSWTISFWFYLDVVGTFMLLGRNDFWNNNANYARGGFFVDYLSDQRLRFRRWYYSNGQQWVNVQTAANSIPLNTWLHIALTSVPGRLAIYVNGAETVTGGVDGIEFSPLYYPTNGLYDKIGVGTICQTSSNSQESCLVDSTGKGHFQDLRFYNYALSSAYISDIASDQSNICVECPINQTTFFANSTSQDQCICPQGSYTKPTDFLISYDDKTFVRENLDQVDFGTLTWNIATNGGFTAVTRAKFAGSPGSYERIFASSAGYNSNVDDIQLLRYYTENKLYVWLGEGSSVRCTNTDIPISQDTWYDIVWRFSTETNFMTLQLNDITYNIDCTSIFASNPVTDRTNPRNYLGKPTYDVNAMFNGEIAGFYAWDRFLSDTEARDVLNSITTATQDTWCVACAPQTNYTDPRVGATSESQCTTPPQTTQSTNDGQWVLGEPDVHCATVCSNIGLQCDAEAQTLTGEQELKDAFAQVGIDCGEYVQFSRFPPAPFLVPNDLYTPCYGVFDGDTSTCDQPWAYPGEGHQALCRCFNPTPTTSTTAAQANVTFLLILGNISAVDVDTNVQEIIAQAVTDSLLPLQTAMGEFEDIRDSSSPSKAAHLVLSFSCSAADVAMIRGQESLGNVTAAIMDAMQSQTALKVCDCKAASLVQDKGKSEVVCSNRPPLKAPCSYSSTTIDWNVWVENTVRGHCRTVEHSGSTYWVKLVLDPFHLLSDPLWTAEIVPDQIDHNSLLVLQEYRESVVMNKLYTGDWDVVNHSPSEENGNVFIKDTFCFHPTDSTLLRAMGNCSNCSEACTGQTFFKFYWWNQDMAKVSIEGFDTLFPVLQWQRGHTYTFMYTLLYELRQVTADVYLFTADFPSACGCPCGVNVASLTTGLPVVCESSCSASARNHTISTCAMYHNNLHLDWRGQESSDPFEPWRAMFTYNHCVRSRTPYRTYGATVNVTCTIPLQESLDKIYYAVPYTFSWVRFGQINIVDPGS